MRNSDYSSKTLLQGFELIIRSWLLYSLYFRFQLSMNIITDLHISLSADDVLRGQGLNPEMIHINKPSLLVAAMRACSRGHNLLHPKAVTRELAVHALRHDRILMEDELSLSSPVVIRHLGNAIRVVAAIGTIGHELEESVTSLFETDPQFALALDGLGNAAVEMLAQQVCVNIAEKVQTKSWTASTPLSPGITGWPVEVGQPQIFALLDPSAAGVNLTPGGMMLPKKTTSFIVGLGPEMSKVKMCNVCNLRETCRYRHG